MRGGKRPAADVRRHTGGEPVKKRAATEHLTDKPAACGGQVKEWRLTATCWRLRKLRLARGFGLGPTRLMGSRHLGFGCRAHPRTHQRLIDQAGFIGMARVVYSGDGSGSPAAIERRNASARAANESGAPFVA